jgi:exodeoxyribonuclease I
MAASFLFYDLETSGVNPREARIMQFAAQRTNLDLEPIGEPYNYLIRLTADVLPDPEAILVTGITPQQTIDGGYTEAEFLKIFHTDIATPGTIFTGFNSVRFDDEFLRFLNYRNFYDPYEWSWKDDRSRWDMLDVVRMTRALRPDGIKWPFASDGSATNRLELLAELNQLTHEKAHDALSDVQATIALAQLIKQQQPKLFDFLLSMRDKRAVADIVSSNQPFVYTSGRYDSEFEKTTVAVHLADVPDQPGAALVYDLRYDAQEYTDKSEDDLLKTWQARHNEREFPMPVKILRYNRCPAIAPLGVLDEASQKRLAIDTSQVKKNYKKLQTHRSTLASAFQNVAQASRPSEQERLFDADKVDVDSRLYDGFFSRKDSELLPRVRAAKPEDLTATRFTFQDDRLNALLPLYKARNYPESLSSEEQMEWENFRYRRLVQGDEKSWLARFSRQLQVTAERIASQSPDKQYLLEELQLYAESIAPIEP